MQTESIPMIEPATLYPIDSARRLMGCTTPSAWREARARGLGEKIKYFGKRGFLLGEDIIATVMSAGKQREYATPAQS